MSSPASGRDGSASRSAPDDAELAVVIVNYNAGYYLDRCLKSLEARRGDVAIDVLVIDNDSRDGSAEAVSRDHPSVRLIRNPDNLGLSAAWNQGIAATSAPYLLFLNPDVELWRGTLAGYLAVAKRRTQAGIVGPLVRNSDGSVYESGRVFPSLTDGLGHAMFGGVMPENRWTGRYRMAGWNRATERFVDWVSGCSMLMPRAALDEVGPFDEEFFLYAEELDMSTRLRAAGWKVLFTPEMELIHELGVSTGRSRKMLLMHSASLLRYYRKHRAGGWRRFTVPMVAAVLRLRAEAEWLRSKIGGK